MNPAPSTVDMQPGLGREPKALSERLYRSLYLIRRAEEEVVRLYPTDKIKSPVHLSIGQEAVSVGACEAMESEDIVFGTYRSHAVYLAKTGDLKGFFAELYGKATGCARGKGGSMHLANVAKGMMGTSAVVATTIPQAAGYAFALSRSGSKAVVLCFFGDGATEEGVFHETLNFCALKKLPIIFVCENNGYAIHTRQDRRQANVDIAGLVRAYGIPSERIESNDAIEIHARVAAAAKDIRSGVTGPYFFECRTCRWKEHVGPGDDFHLGYRTREDLAFWRENDFRNSFSTRLRPEQMSAIESAVESEISEAIRFAESSPFPGTEELYTDVFCEQKAAQSTRVTEPSLDDSRRLGFADSLREAFDLELGRDPSVLVFGLDVDDPKAILGTTKGLVAKYGLERVFGTPLSEDAMTGVAIGMAVAGLRPVHIHIRMDFLMLAMNQLVNIAAKARYTTGGQVSVPLVVRAMIGRSWGQGAQHSQAFHSFFMHVPGFKVAAPSTPYDAKGCMIAAIRDDNPVIFVEHRLLHNQVGAVPLDAYEVKPGNARTTALGKDITLVGISYMQVECLRAREYLLDKGIEAEVIDPIWLSPLDTETIIKSVRKTRRLVIVDNGWTTCGAAAEIASVVAEALEGNGDIRIRRMGFAQVSCPTTPSLELEFYASPMQIAAKAYQVVTGNQDWVPVHRPDLAAVEFKGPF